MDKWIPILVLLFHFYVCEHGSKVEIALDLVDAGVGRMQVVLGLLELFLLELEKVEADSKIDLLVQCLEQIGVRGGDE
ncbi:MAG: hypothetical protein Q9180_007976 [Flavoplaca navasiana]